MGKAVCQLFQIKAAIEATEAGTDKGSAQAIGQDTPHIVGTRKGIWNKLRGAKAQKEKGHLQDTRTAVTTILQGNKAQWSHHKP